MKAFKINFVTVIMAFAAMFMMGITYGYQTRDMFSALGMQGYINYVIDMSNWPIGYQIAAVVGGWVIEIGIVALPVTLLIGIIVKVVKWINK